MATARRATAASTETTAAAIASIIATDPTLAERVRGVVNLAIDMAEYTLRWGSPADQMQLMRSVMPQMMQALRQVDSSEADAEATKAYNRLQAAIAGRPIPEK